MGLSMIKYLNAIISLRAPLYNLKTQKRFKRFGSHTLTCICYPYQQVRVHAPPTDYGRLDYALEVAVKLLSHFEKLFGEPFPLPKLGEYSFKSQAVSVRAEHWNPGESWYALISLFRCLHKMTQNCCLFPSRTEYKQCREILLSSAVLVGWNLDLSLQSITHVQ